METNPPHAGLFQTRQAFQIRTYWAGAPTRANRV